MEDLFVNRVRLNRENIDNNKYPFNIKCLNNFEELKLDNSVTLFYGENGVGKSTLIEAIAIALGLNPEGGSNNMQFSNYDDYSDLYKHLKISKFVKLRPMLSGRTLILYDNGTLFKENFKKAKIDLNEFLVQCRTNGFFNLSDIKTALLEGNGKISFLPYSDRRPANPSDFNIKPKEDSIVTNLILDGKVMEENLKELQLDKLWLNETL